MRSNPERVHVEPKDGQVTILHGDIKVYHFPGTNYQLNSVDSVIQLVKWKGSKDNTVIFYDENQIQVILDDSLMDRPQDKAIYGFEYTQAFSEWTDIFGNPLNQKQFVDFLKRRPWEESHIIEPLLAQVQNLKLMTEIIGDYSYDDHNNLTFMFKTKDGEKMTKLPTVITLDMIILNESTFNQQVEFELELKKPKAENEKPMFIVTCPKLKRYVKEAVEHEVSKMKKELDGYLIMAGHMGR